MSDNHDWQSDLDDDKLNSDALDDDTTKDKLVEVDYDDDSSTEELIDIGDLPNDEGDNVDYEDDTIRDELVDHSDLSNNDVDYEDDTVSEGLIDDADAPDEPERTFEDLTLAELVGQFVKSPRRTSRALLTVTGASRTSESTSSPAIPAPIATARSTPLSDGDVTAIPNTMGERVNRLISTKLTTQQVQLLLYLLALVCGLIGSSLLLGSPDVRRSEDNALVIGAPYLWMAVFIWLGAELYGSWNSIVAWWNRSDRLMQIRWVSRILPIFVWLTALLLYVDAMTAPAELTLGLVQIANGRLFLGVLLWVLIDFLVMVIRYIAKNNPEGYAGWVHIEPTKPQPQTDAVMVSLRSVWLGRTLLLIGATISSVLVWLGTPDNQIPPPIIILWVVSTILWALFFAPLRWSLFDWATGKVDAVRRINWGDYSWAVAAFILIMILGMGFRFAQLDTLPGEMTSDHVEKILDSNRVYNGEYNIFFANNGGREPIQMYLMSLFTNIPGLDFNHFTLKLLAALQSLVTLPLLVWLGVEVMGERNRKFGVLVGLLLAGMVAVSYWHVAITRQALRIVMTPIFTSLLMIFLARAMRHNRRSDYIKAALVLGFGLYAYQAVRMLPVVIVAGIAIAVMVRSISWRERLMFGVNLAVLVFISFMVFLPMLHYSVEDPDHFWRRTAGRLLGDDVITEKLADGTIVERKASSEEQIAAFNANVPILMTNVRNALLMYNWKGDVGWISGVPNEPAMDIYAGTFLILGLAGWMAMMIRSRDPVIWLMPVMIFIMLLPSALSIAYPLENPSHTRTSGSIPPVYLIVAFSMALIAFRFVENLPKRYGVTIAVIFCGGMILLANQRNATLYFDRYPPIYIESSYPYSEAGSVLRGFAESDGSYGNAFMIAYPHWWGHRAIGIAAGKPFWPNGIVSINDVPSFLNVAQLRDDEFELDWDKDLLFLYSADDEATSFQLKEWFPDGREQEIQSYHPDDKYRLYRVPFLGEEGFYQFMAEYGR